MRVELMSSTVARSRSSLSYARTKYVRPAAALRSGDGPLPHPSCKRALRLPGRNAGAARERMRSREQIWYPTRDSNPEHPASEAGASAVVAPAGHGTSSRTRAPAGALAHEPLSRAGEGAAGPVPQTKSPEASRRIRAFARPRSASYIGGVSRFAGRTESSARAQPGACRNAGEAFGFCIATFICTAFLFQRAGFARGTGSNVGRGKRLTRFSS